MSVTNETLLEAIRASNDSNNKQFSTIQDQLNNLHKTIEENTKTLQQNTNKIHELETENQKLKDQVKQLQSALKNNNIVIYGLTESESDYELVENLLENKLNIQIVKQDINNLFRLGKREQKIRPLLIQFVSNLKKQEIFKNIAKLKGSNISISNDLTKEEREDKKVLWEHYKLAKEKKNSCTLRDTFLIVNGEKFTPRQLQDNIDITHTSTNTTIIEESQKIAEETDKKHQETNKKRPLEETEQEVNKKNKTEQKTQKTIPRNLRSNCSNSPSTSTPKIVP